MEKPPVLISHTKDLALTNIDQLNDYVSTLSMIYNNPHKYSVLCNEIGYDPFGNPEVELHYCESKDEEESKRKKVTLFAEIVSIANLKHYDNLVTDHWAKKIIITYIGKFSNKDKECPMKYKIVIYYKPEKGVVLPEEAVKSLMPVESRK